MRSHARVVHVPLVFCLVVVGVVVYGGCDVGDPADVARLTVRNLGAVTRLVERDSTCGFSSPRVRAAGELRVGSDDVAVYTESVDNCTIDLGLGRIIDQDCIGTTTLGMGRVVVSARRTLAGTRNTEAAGADDRLIVQDAQRDYALHLDMVRFDQFEVTRSDSRKSLRAVDGTVSGVVVPTLVPASAADGCMRSLNRVAFVDVRYRLSTLVVERERRRTALTVASSDLRAWQGDGASDENYVEGQLEFTDEDNSFSGRAELEDALDRDMGEARGGCAEVDDAGRGHDLGDGTDEVPFAICLMGA